MKFLDKLRLCPECTRFLNKKVGLCALCASQILINPKLRTIRDMRLYSLIDWSESDTNVGKLIYNLKGGYQEEAWAFWTKKFYVNFEGLSHLNNPLFIPVPALFDKKDHAYHFAAKTAEIFNGEVWGGLKRCEVNSQKEKTKAERRAVQFQSVKLPLKDIKQSVILMDDVVTTGSTARAAYEALQKPNNFMIWSLCYRQLSCDVVDHLL